MLIPANILTQNCQLSVAPSTVNALSVDPHQARVSSLACPGVHHVDRLSLTWLNIDYYEVCRSANPLPFHSDQSVSTARG